MMQHLGEGGARTLQVSISLDGQKSVLLEDDIRAGGGRRCVTGGVTVPVFVLRGT